jgi:hypothetical protein
MFYRWLQLRVPANAGPFPYFFNRHAKGLGKPRQVRPGGRW